MQLRLAGLFTDNMVLQRDMPVPVWGWAAPKEKITVRVARRSASAFAGQSASAFTGQSAGAVAGKDGRWMATLAPMPAGGPLEMTVAAGQGTLVVRNVMVGEVWIGSGQSNMEWPVAQSLNAEAEIAGATYPSIRLFTVPKLPANHPQQDVQGAWQECSPDSVGSFSAVAYFFGRELHGKLNVPIGLIHSSWGGTMAEPWTSREGLLAEPSLRDIVESYENGLANFDQAMAEYQVKLAEYQDKHYPKDPGNSGFTQGWADPATPTSEWDDMRVPCPWQSAGLNFNGVVWFRREVDVPAAWAGKELTVSLGPCDDCDTTYFNNVQVGAVGKDTPNYWAFPRVYKAPGPLVRAGRNVVAVRIYDHGGAGGFTGSASQMGLVPSGDAGATPIRLAGVWRYKVEHNFGLVQLPPGPQMPFGPGNPNAPFALYNGMIAPLIPYAIRGGIWYQGESNADRAYRYRTIFPAMIRDWRRRWGLGDFPFLFVQLANHMPQGDQPGQSAWAELREAQTMTLKEPNTGMAVAIDIGEAMDVHPKNKQDVGKRLALPALAKVYGMKDLAYSGPIYRSMKIEGGEIHLTFDHVGGGLVAKGAGGSKLTGFAIAGRDRKFVWAEAEIRPSALRQAQGSGQMDQTVVVWTNDVPKPVAVRYAWADNPVCNLYNAAGLPASPFRTDDWPISTQPRK